MIGKHPCDEGVVLAAPASPPCAEAARPWVLAATILGSSLGFTVGSYWTTFFAPMVVLGLGMAVVIAPLSTTVMNAVDVRHVGIGSGINNAVSRVGGLLAIAIIGVLVLHAFSGELDRRLAGTLAPDVVAALDMERVKLAAAEPPSTASPSDRIAIQQAVSTAFVTAFRYMTLAAAGLALASALTAATMIGGSVAEHNCLDLPLRGNV